MYLTRYTALVPVLFMFLFIGLSGRAAAQIRYGIRAGLNFASFRGPSETDNAGANLESWQNTTGFHLGISFSQPITDQFGVRGELMYNKLGSKYRHNGSMYRAIRTSTGSTLTTGTGDLQLLVNNTYITVPVSAYGRWGDFEFSAGPYVSFLVQSVADGTLTYNGQTAQGQPTGELRHNLLYNYRRDDIGEATGTASETVTARLNGVDVPVPKTLGAYYDYPDDRGALFNGIDYGVVGGVSYFLSRTLFFSARLQYGLADITNNDADLSRTALGSDGSPVFRADTDRNFAIQVAIGFSF